MSEKLLSHVKTTPHDQFEARLEGRKLDAMKELAYGASHEINNPLANIAARAQTLLRDEKDHQRRQALLAIHKQALRAHEMISDLMLFARPPELIRKKLDVRVLIDRVATELADSCQQHEVRFITDLPKNPVEIIADAEQLAVALSALCTNSLEAIGVSGSITVTLRWEPAEETPHLNPPHWNPPHSNPPHSNPPQGNSLQGGDPGRETRHGNVVIGVSDDGPGLSEQARRHLFDPFYSGREAGRGLGFGLSKCWRIITEHGGTITVANRPAAEESERETCFTISLPTDSGTPPLSRGKPKT